MMRYEFNLPDLGEGLTEAEIVNWRVAVGDAVTEDQALVEVETAKAMVEIPSPVTGTVVQFGGTPGDVLPVGALLIAFDTKQGSARHNPDERAQPDTTEQTKVPGIGALPVTGSPATAEPAGSRPRSTISPAVNGKRSRVLAAPSTRKYATSLGVDLSRVHGSGPAGRVTREDVDRAAHQSQTEPPTAAAPDRAAAPAPRPAARTIDGQCGIDEEVPLRGIRRQIARTMTKAWQQIPHVTEFRELDATRLVEAHRAFRERVEEAAPKLTFLPFLVLACAAALRRHRILNASLDAERDILIYRGSVNVGIATSHTEGLVVPVLRDADRLGLLEVSRRIAELTEAVRSRRVRADQLDDGTFTVTNFGSYGTWLGTPIVNPPQAAIAGFGRIRDTVVAVDGQPVVRPTLPIAVSADHRIINGDVLGAFVNDLAALLENPILLLGEVR